MADMMEKKNYDLTEITRLLLEMRDNCIAKTGDVYEDPKRAEKYDALNAAIFLINNPSTSKQWISVEDRLPEDDVEVLVYAIGNNENSVVCMTSYTHNMHGYNIEGWRTPWQYFFYEHKITHWMLPPQPPKEE